MSAGTWDLAIDQGTDWEQPVTYGTQSDPLDAGTFAPVDLTGWHARMQIRPRPGGRVLASLTDDAEGGITLDGGNEPNILLALTNVQSSALPAGQARYDLELVDPDGRVLRLLQGAVAVSAEITK